MSSRILRVLLAVLLSFAQSGLICQDLQPPPGKAVPILPEASLKARARLIEKMDHIIFPTIRFDGVSIEEAIEQLRVKSREFDKGTAAAGAKGVSIELRMGDEPNKATISLDLKDVPMSEALRYVTELAQMHLKVRTDSVLIVPLSEAIPELFIRSFRVPPDFLSIAAHDSTLPHPVDPFAAPTDRPPGSPPPLSSSKRILEAQGVTFPEGSSAFFNPTTGLLTVINTLPNIDLVEAFTDTVINNAPSTIAHQLIIVEGPGELIRAANAAASRVSDARQALDTLLDHTKKPASRVRVVADAFLEGKSGVHSRTSAVREHVHTTGLEFDSKSRATTAWEMRPLGLSLTVEPTLGADGRTLDNTLSIQFPPLAPEIRQLTVTEPLTGHDTDRPVSLTDGAEIKTSIVSFIGSTKLVGVMKAVGLIEDKADVLWAAFLTSSRRRVDGLPALAQPKAVSKPLPAGMTAATFRAPEGLIDGLMADNERQPVRDWLEAQGITFGEGASMEQRGENLDVVNTPAMNEALSALIQEADRMARHSLAFTLHTVQAPAELLRDLTRKTMTTSADDTPMLTAIEAAVERGEARFIDSVVLEDRPGWRSVHQSGIEHSFLSGFGINASHQPEVEFDMRPVGSLLEIEPTLSADGFTVILRLTHELHSALPEMRGAHFRDPASGKPFAMPATDYHVLTTATSFEMIRGGTKLVSLHKPTGRKAEGQLWATFLKCDAVPQVAKSDRPPDLAKNIPEGGDLETRSYKVPPDFLTRGTRENDPSAEATSADPFETAAPRRTERRSPGLLESKGIYFPEGSSASFNPATSSLVVRNTRKNLALVEAWVRDVVHALPKTVTITTHVIQAPGPLLRRLAAQTSGKLNHRAELDELLAAVKIGNAQSLGTNRIETKPGNRASTQQGRKHAALSEVSINKEGVPEIITVERNVGFKVELEPTVGDDGQLVELQIAPEFHTAAPIEHRERILDTQGRRLEFPLTDYHVAKLTTATTIPDGTARLISLYKPTGKPEFEKEDILQAIFITCDILRAGK